MRAKRVGVATNAYTGNLLPPLGRSASEPLDPKLRETIVPGNQSAGDSRPDVRYFRFDWDNRLKVGGLKEMVRGANFARTGGFMTRRMQGLFPQIGSIKWRWRWSGQLAINMDRAPHLYNPAEGLYELVGYSGRGVPTATALGEVLGEAGCGVPAGELPMDISELKPLAAGALLSALVPRLRGPINRVRSIWS